MSFKNRKKGERMKLRKRDKGIRKEREKERDWR